MNTELTNNNIDFNINRHYIFSPIEIQESLVRENIQFHNPPNNSYIDGGLNFGSTIFSNQLNNGDILL